MNSNNNEFQNKYRIPSNRLQKWDYSINDAYFVTICTQNRECYFGEIFNQEMQLSELGQLAFQFWMEIPNHFSFVKLGGFVIMPNHMYGIIIIDKNNGVRITSSQIERTLATPNLGVSSTAASKKRKPSTLGVIINQYKRIVTINARKIHSDFAWQSHFHDHIIRNEKSYKNISEYILHNPVNLENEVLIG